MIVADETTELWLRNDGDERAVANGCEFSVLTASWTVWWIEHYCKLYEGEGYAGQPLILHGCLDCDHSAFYAPDEEWWLDDACTIPGPAQDSYPERARLFSECVAAGHHLDWQYEAFMRLFGWVHDSVKWGRKIRRFRQGSFWFPKKQKKSPTLAALGMYLLAGDGEPGQKVFLAAKDGDQARKNAAKHTVEMWLQSDYLQAVCTLNRSTMQLTHEPSRSVMYPLSSSNAKTQQSKEGLNGSILIDETHVVDRPFVNRINRAGISRSEPLFCEFSTAGNNPDGYGKERFDYASDVLSGKIVNQELLAVIHAAPQDVTDEQLEEEFEHYAKSANPSYGHTIDPIEIRNDYEQSKVSIEQLGLFKMYRLNVWQHSSNPWIRPSDWEKCGAEYGISDLRGRRCYGGIDLSMRWDLTAFTLIFPWNDDPDDPEFRLWTYLFLPRESAKKSADKVSWFTYEKDGDLTITEGNGTDFKLVQQTVVEASRLFDLQDVAFDPQYAAKFAQDLQDDDGILVREFRQSVGNFAEPLDFFENRVVTGKMQHPRNRCLNWQIGNATKGRNGLLDKPENEYTKKIDGVVAGVMALGMWQEYGKNAGAWSPEDGILL